MKKLCKRYINILAWVIAVVFMLAACSSANVYNEGPAATPYDYVVIEEYYEVYGITKYLKPQYQYFIFDNEHEVLDYGVTFRLEPHISESHGLIKFRLGIGTALREYRYYDPEIRLRSESFYNTLTETHSLVAYQYPGWLPDKIIVQDIFDKTCYYREFTIAFAHNDLPVTSAEFIDRGTKLKITYLHKGRNGQDDYETTETLDLT